MSRVFAAFCAALAFAAAFSIDAIGQGRGAGTADPCTGSRDLRLTNGRFVTMDARGTTASELVIQNGRIASVGPAAGRAQPVHADGESWRADGRAGLIDNHNHIVLLGIRPGYHTPLEGLATIAAAQAALTARAKSVPAGAFMTSMGGWNPAQFAEKRLPTLAELDAAAAQPPGADLPGVHGPRGHQHAAARRSSPRRASRSAMPALSPPMRLRSRR